MKILLIAGARPNFMKIAPILREIEKHPNTIEGILVHTGQHYDHNMSRVFFNALGIKRPDYNLEVGSGSHACQTAEIMVRFEKVCEKESPDLVLVVGDVNSTIATGLVAKKLHIQLVHVEAGLRSGDRKMPEEINRIATDAITDYFFTTEKEGTENLVKEGHPLNTIHFVGHVMIDNLFYQMNKHNGKPPSEFAENLKKRLETRYIAMTMHRPSNVDNKNILEKLLTGIVELSIKTPIIFPCHPRTFKQIKKFGLEKKFQILSDSNEIIKSGCWITDPMDYDDFLYIWKDAALLLTDSGGLQEETTALKIPCITIRENTERPITVEIGSNVVVGTDPDKIISYGNKALLNDWKECKIPDLWDGKASQRIVEILGSV